MKIGIAGIGRLGISLALNLENVGYEVIGYDLRKDYVEKLQKKQISTCEPDVERLLKQSKKFEATSDVSKLLNESDVVFIVIQTPSKDSGEYDHQYIDFFFTQVYEHFLKNRNLPKHFVINSTVMPGYCAELNKKLGMEKYFNISYNPEFIAQGRIIYDQLHPDLVLIGQANEECGNQIQEIYTKMCKNKPIFCKMSPTEAEITKISLNCFLTMKIAYANMVGDLCIEMDASPEKVLNAIGSDSRINNKYLRWGYGPGGPCTLPTQLVQTSNGLKQIQDIKVGDYVFTHKGRLRKVTEIFITPFEGQMNKLKIAGNNQKLLLTPDHPVFSSFTVFDRKERTFKYFDTKKQKIIKRYSTVKNILPPEFAPIQLLQQGDYCVLPQLEIDKFSLKNYHFSDGTIMQFNDQIMKLLGLFLAEGNTDGKHICFTLHSKEIELQNFIVQCAKEQLNRKANIYVKSKNAVRVRFTFQEMAEWLNLTFGKGCKSKKIPYEWLGLADQLLNSLIEGIWLGDGSRSNNSYTLGMISKDIINFNKLWMMKNGIAHCFNVNPEHIGKDNVKHQESYYLTVSNPYYINKMSNLFSNMKLTRNNLNLKKTIWFEENQMFCRINEVESIYYCGNVYNIEVEEDHSYMLDNCVVHNCLGRDQKAFTVLAEQLQCDSIIPQAVDMANKNHLYKMVQQAIKNNKPRYEMVEGVAYKPGTDIITDSQQLSFAVEMENAGYKVVIYDRKEVIDQVRELYPNKDFEFHIVEQN